MMLQNVQSAITAIVAPVVMVTACAILVGGMLTQYNQTNDRLRAFAKERLNLLRTEDGGIASISDIRQTFAKERLVELDTQLPRLLRRYRHVRNAVLTMYCAVLVFFACMLTISVAYWFQSSGWAISALALFLVGMLTALTGMVQHALYVLGGNVSVMYETERILKLGR